MFNIKLRIVVEKGRGGTNTIKFSYDICLIQTLQIEALVPKSVYILSPLNIIDTRRKQMSRKKKTRNVKTELKTKSVAKLDEDINRILEENPEDGDLEKLIAEEGKEFAGYSPPHTIRGIPFEEFKERQRQYKEQYEDT